MSGPTALLDYKKSLLSRIKHPQEVSCELINFHTTHSFDITHEIATYFFTFQLIVEFQNETYRERHGSVSETYLTSMWSLTTSVFLPGGMIGAFIGGWIADLLGR